MNLVDQITVFEGFAQQEKPDFKLMIAYYTKKILITNSDTPAKLLINLLNILSLWFNLNLLDLHIYVKKVVFVFEFVHRSLIRLKTALIPHITTNSNVVSFYQCRKKLSSYY